MLNCSILFLVLILYCVEGSRCPDGEFDKWKEFRGFCYHFSERSATWRRAKEACTRAAEGSYIADILSEEENNWIFERLNTYHYYEDYYIGATDREWEGHFVWENSGESLDDTYTNWNEGEPNQHLDTPENCAEMKISNGKWNDIPCDIVMRYVCKLPVYEK
ncbi:lectin BRA-3-like [Argopecten irradians]|uniref:lectin BRA-3-like n=1 Tax=Argopecten irradians TaxID=31199 RepID=UPI0037219218